MPSYDVSADAFAALFSRTEKERVGGMKNALYEGAVAGVGPLVKKAPKDQGLTRQSIHAEPTDKGGVIEIDAPHAGIVDLGSRPHMPPYEPIAEWVRRVILKRVVVNGLIGPALPQRKMFGQTGGQIGPVQASARLNSSYGKRARRLTSEEKEDADIFAIVKAIRFKIAHYGTRPSFFVRDSMPELERRLMKIVKAHLAIR